MLSDLFDILNSITAFKDKVAYKFFPVGCAPALPFICYEMIDSDNIFSDNQVWHERMNININLYSANKDTTSEGLIENALNSNKIPWNKDETYIDSEQCYMITYSVQLL